MTFRTALPTASPRLLYATACVVVAAVAACQDQGPGVYVRFDETSSELVSTYGTDSVMNFIGAGSEIALDGVFYGEVSCAGLTSDAASGVGGRQRINITIIAGSGTGCARETRRVGYHIAITSLEPAIYTVEIFHSEPGTTRGTRSVFAQYFDLRGPP
jgi:hypothetical protein